MHSVFVRLLSAARDTAFVCFLQKFDRLLAILFPQNLICFNSSEGTTVFGSGLWNQKPNLKIESLLLCIFSRIPNSKISSLCTTIWWRRTAGCRPGSDDVVKTVLSLVLCTKHKIVWRKMTSTKAQAEDVVTQWSDGCFETCQMGMFRLCPVFSRYFFYLFCLSIAVRWDNEKKCWDLETGKIGGAHSTYFLGCRAPLLLNYLQEETKLKLICVIELCFLFV